MCKTLKEDFKIHILKVVKDGDEHLQAQVLLLYFLTCKTQFIKILPNNFP